MMTSRNRSSFSVLWLASSLTIASVFAAFLWQIVHKGATSGSDRGNQRTELICVLPCTYLPASIRQLIFRFEQKRQIIRSDTVAIPPSLNDTTRIKFSNLPIGRCLMSVRARDSVGHTQFAGVTDCVLRADSSVTVRILLNKRSKERGDAEIKFVWNDRHVKWEMDLNNPVIATTEDSWDMHHYYVCYPTVLRSRGLYMMWYASGYNVYYTAIDSEWTAYASSTDGLNWQKHGPVKAVGPIPSWTSVAFVGRAFLVSDTVFQMWFEAKSKQNPMNGIGYAVSSDGIHWHLSLSPILRPSALKPCIFGPSIVKTKKEYYLYYSVQWSANGKMCQEIHLARSINLRSWKDEGPVLKGRPNIQWESAGVSLPAVFIDRGRWKMFYTTTYPSSLGHSSCIGYAESDDGIHWTQMSDVPELAQIDTLPWKTLMVAHPWVSVDRGRLQLWFAALDAKQNRWQIGYAHREMDGRDRGKDLGFAVR